MVERSARTYHEDLARAASPSRVCELVLARLLEKLRISGANVVAFGSPTEEAPRAALFQHDTDPELTRRYTASGLERLLAEPGLPELFAQPDCRLRVEEALGWEYWLRSETYREHFRHTASARQLVVGFRDRSGVPRGFMAVCRAETDPAFDAEEEAVILACRAEAEQALSVFSVFPRASTAVGGVLEALTTTLPIPALLVSASRRVLWMNREAQIRFGTVGLRFDRRRWYTVTTDALNDLVALAMREHAQPGALIALPECERRPSWLATGESVVARRFEAPDAEPSVLVCVQAVAPRVELDVASVRRQHKLSAREAEVALLAAEGYSVLAIAHQLGIAESTVGSHLKRLYQKLQVRSRVELALCLGSRGVR